MKADADTYLPLEPTESEQAFQGYVRSSCSFDNTVDSGEKFPCLALSAVA